MGNGTVRKHCNARPQEFTDKSVWDQKVMDSTGTELLNHIVQCELENVSIPNKVTGNIDAETAWQELGKISILDPINRIESDCREEQDSVAQVIVSNINDLSGDNSLSIIQCGTL